MYDIPLCIRENTREYARIRENTREYTRIRCRIRGEYCKPANTRQYAANTQDMHKENEKDNRTQEYTRWIFTVRPAYLRMDLIISAMQGTRRRQVPQQAGGFIFRTHVRTVKTEV